MTHTTLRSLAARYFREVQRLAELHQQNQVLPVTDVLDCLRCRDRIAQVLTKTALRDDIADQIIAGDQHISTLGKAIADTPELAAWRQSFAPANTAWWWPQPPRRRSTAQVAREIVLPIAVFVAVAVVMFLANDLFRCWFGEIPEVLIGFGASVSALLTFVITIGLMRPLNAETIGSVVATLPIPRYDWMRLIVRITLVLLAGLIVVRLGYTVIASFAHGQGQRAQAIGALADARSWYERALRFAPDQTLTNYQLGSLFEDLDDTDQAKQYYTAAVYGQRAGRNAPNTDFAFNNLARLYILEGKYDRAVPLLMEGISVVKQAQTLANIQNTESLTGTLLAMRKNLAWARIEQGEIEQNPARYHDALNEAREAVRLAESLQNVPGAAVGQAFCVHAEALQRLERGEQSEWLKCLVAIEKELGSPDADHWHGLARRYTFTP